MSVDPDAVGAIGIIAGIVVVLTTWIWQRSFGSRSAFVNEAMALNELLRHALKELQDELALCRSEYRALVAEREHGRAQD